jgi:hypothetical protein
MDDARYPTSLGTSDADHITLLGKDLAGELMDQVSFGELAFWLVSMRRPTPGELRLFEATLVALADHGFTPSAIAARLTYFSAPESVQGAIAAGILGGGSRFLGVTEDTARFLAGALATQPAPLPAGQPGWDRLATEVLTQHGVAMSCALLRKTSPAGRSPSCCANCSPDCRRSARQVSPSPAPLLPQRHQTHAVQHERLRTT